MGMSYQKNAPKGFTNIHGKMYKQVVLRVNEFRTSDNFAGFGIDTSIKDFGFQSGFVVVEAKITDPKGRIVGSGLAEEKRGSSNINKFSALENCETSAIGRALSSIGLGGEEYCSAEELLLSLDKQEEDKKNKNSKKENQDTKRKPPVLVPNMPDIKLKEEFKHTFATASRYVGQKRVLSICKVSLEKDKEGQFSKGLSQLKDFNEMQLRACISDLLKLDDGIIPDAGAK